MKYFSILIFVCCNLLFIQSNGLSPNIQHHKLSNKIRSNLKESRSQFQVTIITNGSYYFQVNNVTWLSSSATMLRANALDHNNYDKSLILEQTTANDCHDRLGHCQSVNFIYSLNDDSSTIFKCSLTTYDEYNLVKFTQNFPNGAQKTSVPNRFDSVISSFPSFEIKNYDKTNIGYLSYGGMMAGDMEKLYGKWNILTSRINDGISGGPLVLFNTKGDTIIISSMSEFMISSSFHNKYLGGSLNYGIMSGIDQITKNFSIEFLVYYSDQGINKAMEEWGALLVKYYNKNLAIKENDFTNNYLSYWLDNGAYYYWLTEDGKTYQETIFDIVKHFQDINIPFRTLQYDSWWYGAERGYRQGCFEWNGNKASDRFPDSLVIVYNKTGLPITAHNKFWDYSVKYARQNGGNYNFFIDDFTKKALPYDERFWYDLFENSTDWGLRTYEQDWLNHQTLDFTPLLTNISLGKTWLRQMADAASYNNMTVQYCMSLSRHVMTSLEHDAVTQIRVTNDYATNWEYGGQQWRLGVSSIFASALGLAPFKDVYWTTRVQPNNPYGTKAVENFVELESVVSILTAGPVGPGDRIGYMNRELIMRSCNAEGLLLKPSKPITSLDQQIHAKVFGQNYGPIGEVWSTYSFINKYTFGIIFGADLKNEFSINKINAGFNLDNNSVFWKYGYEQTIYQFSKDNQIHLNKNCTMKEFCLYHVSPSFNINNMNLTLIGEQNKWVPMSPKRFKDIQINQNTVVLQANGVLNENLFFSYAVNLQLKTEKNCIFRSSQMTIKLTVVNSSIQFSCS